MTSTVLIAALALAGAPGAQSLTDAQAYYPIEPGNTWTYESSIRGRFTNQVVDSLVSQESVIFRVRSTDSSGRHQMLMVRHDGSRLYLGAGVESLALISDFGLEVGASTPTLMGTQDAILTLAARHESLSVYGIQFDDVVEVHIAPRRGGGVTYYFARGVGLVGMESASPAFEVRLVHATVSGRTIAAPVRN
jgi:hypothetical protein